MNILIVDDSTAMRMLIKKTLRTAGFNSHTIIEASDGVAALEMICAEPPDLVLSDWNMPNMTGLELLQNVRTKGYNMNYGFITTEATIEMRELATQAGASFLIAKPFTPEAFAMVLEPYLNN